MTKKKLLRDLLLNNNRVLTYTCYIASFLSLMTGYYFSVARDSDQRSNWLVLSFCIFFLLGSVVYIANSTRYINLLDFMLAHGLFFAFFGLLSSYSTKPNSIVAIAVEVAFGVPMLCGLVILPKRHKTDLVTSIKSLKCTIVNNKIFAALLLLFVLFCLETLNVTMVCDADVYFHTFENIKGFDFTLSTLDNLKLGGHICLGYVIVYGIGYLLCSSNAFLLRLTNIVLICLSSICIYRIVKRIDDKASSNVAALCTGVYLFNPLIMGMVYDINLDLPSCIFFVILIFAVVERRSILFALMSFLLVFSKETGIILYAGVVFELMLSDLMQKMDLKQRFIRLAIIMAPITWYMSFWLTGKLWRQSTFSEHVNSSVTQMSSFSISNINIMMKTKEMFLAQFSWLIWGIIIISLMIHRGFKNKIKIPYVVSMILFAAFQMVYVTYVFMRYITPWVVFEVILLAFAVNLINNERKKQVVLALICTLLFMESFMTIDPITKRQFNTVNIGDTEIVSTRTFIRGG